MRQSGNPDAPLHSPAPGRLAVPAGPPLDVHGAVVLTRLRNPYWAYLDGLGSPESRRTMAGCLDRIVALQAAGQGVPAAALTALGPPVGQWMPWHELRWEHTAALRATLAAQTRPPARPGTRPVSWAPAYVNKHLAALRGVLKAAWRLDLMSTEDYLRAQDLAPVTGSRERAGRHLTAAEVGALLAVCLADPAAAGTRDAALLALLYTAGLRRAEAAGAGRADYHAAARTLQVIGKGNRQRTLQIHEVTALYLGQWLARAGHTTGALFCALPHGNLPAAAADPAWAPAPLAAATIADILDRRVAQAGIPITLDLTKPTPHDLRRACIGALLDTGADLSTAQKIAGHAGPATTARYDLRPDRAQREAVNRIALPTPDQAMAAPLPPPASSPAPPAR